MEINSSARQLAENIRHDLGRKLVVITGARQAGKTTLARQLMADFEPAQYLNWDVPADRTLIAGNAWSPKARLVVFDEIHKMKDWKGFLKGAWDGRSPGQAMLVTGSARMDTFRQGGESLAGRYFNWRLHPFSVRELVEKQGISPAAALALLLERGGFPEPCLASSATEARLAALQRYLAGADPADAAWALQLLVVGKPRRAMPAALLRAAPTLPLSATRGKRWASLWVTSAAAATRATSPRISVTPAACMATSTCFRSSGNKSCHDACN